MRGCGDDAVEVVSQIEFDRVILTAGCRGVTDEVDRLRWELELREDVVVESSVAERAFPTGREAATSELLLTLRKLTPHRWDRLLWDEKEASISKDWRREDKMLPDEDEVELPRARNIVQLSYEGLLELASEKIAVVAMRFPWCTACEEKNKAFVKATKVVGGKTPFSNVTFGVLDLREHKTAARRWRGTACHKEDCHLHVFKPDEPLDEPYEVDLRLLYEMDEMSMMTDPMAGAPGHTPKPNSIKPDFDRFERELSLLLPPALTAVEDAEAVADLTRRHRNVVVGSGALINATELRRLARRLRGAATVALLTQSAASPEEPLIELWAREATPERTPLRFDGQATPLDADDLERFVQIHSQPLLQNYSWDLKTELEKPKLPVALLWVNYSDVNSTNVTQKALQAFGKVCDLRRGRNASRHLLCAVKDASFSYYQKEYGTQDPYPFPFFGLTKTLGFTEGDRFAYPFKEPVNKSVIPFFSKVKQASKQLDSFVGRVLAGRVVPSHESGALPERHAGKWVRGEVQDIVWKTYQQQINGSTADTLLEIYDGNRKSAHLQEAAMQMIALALKDYSNLKVARIDGNHNYIQGAFGRKKYAKETEYFWVPPSIASGQWAPEDPVKYTGGEPVNAQKLLKFLKKHSLSHWSLKEALEVVSDREDEILGRARMEKREDDRADAEKQEMIQKMMKSLKQEKGLVDVGEMMRQKNAAGAMAADSDPDAAAKAEAKKKEKKPHRKPAEAPGAASSVKAPARGPGPAKRVTIQESAAEIEKRREARRKELQKQAAKDSDRERKDKEKRKRRREEDKKRKERKKKEEAERKKRADEELARRTKKRKEEAERRAMKPTTPFFSWGQNKEHIFVSVSVPNLNGSSVNVTLKDDNVAVAAQDGRKRPFILEFELREFVNLTNSTWSLRYSEENPLNPKPDGITFSLQKALKHRWDRLAQNHVAVKPFMKKDWVQDDGDLEEEEDVDMPSGGNIKKVTAAVLSNMSANNAMLVAAFRLPWCEKCKEKDKHFVKFTKKVKSDEVEHLRNLVFAVVDVREEKYLGRLYNVTCDEQCELHMFKQDEPDEPYVIPGKRYSEEIQIECYKHLLPAVNEVKDKEMLDRLTGAFDTAIVGFFQGNKTTDPWYRKFKSVGRHLRGHALFGAIFEGKPPKDFGIDHDAAPMFASTSTSSTDSDGDSGDNATRPVVLLFKPKEKRHVEFKDELTMERLSHFSRVLSLPLVSTYDFEERKKYQELKVPIGMLWLDDLNPQREENQWAQSVLRRLAVRFSGHLVFARMNGTRDALLMRPMGLDPRKEPTFGIAATDDFESEKFGFDMEVQTPDELTAFWKDQDGAYERLAAFCSSFLDKSLQVSHESADIPRDYEWGGPGQIHEVVWKTYEQAVNESDHDILLELYSPFRPQHHTFAMVLDLVAQGMGDVKGIKIARMDTENNHVPPEFGLKIDKSAGPNMGGMMGGMFGGGDSSKEKPSSYYFLRGRSERGFGRPKRFGGKSGKAEAIPEKLMRFLRRETQGHLDWDVEERVEWVNKEAGKRLKRLRALEKDHEKKMQDEWMQKEMEEFERYKRLGKFDNMGLNN